MVDLTLINEGLQSSAIARMKQTWKGVAAKLVAEFESNFQDLFLRNYRQLRNMVLKSHAPRVPFLGVYLSDLTFIEDGNSEFVELQSSELPVDATSALSPSSSSSSSSSSDTSNRDNSIKLINFRKKLMVCCYHAL
jgi:hypothetical protein